MEIADLEILADMVRSSNVGELTLRHDGERITIRKSASTSAPSDSLIPDEDDYIYATEYSNVTDEDGEQITEEYVPTVVVTAPLVGVFGHVKPLVGLNARVTEGQVMGAIEAMKIMTEIKAPVSGTIVDLFIEDGHPVEFGQALFEIRAE
jgi:biotin carboxyl carrier protein